MSIAYYRRWFWKYMAVSYLCSFTAAWLFIEHAWKAGIPMCIAGFVLALAAGRQTTLARREEHRL